MVTCKTATANQWNELMHYLHQHYKADMIELSEYLTDYDYSGICEALTEYGIIDWLWEQGYLTYGSYDLSELNLTDYKNDWPDYAEALQESKMNDLTVNFNNGTYKNLKSFVKDEPDWEEFFDEKFAEMAK